MAVAAAVLANRNRRGKRPVVISGSERNEAYEEQERFWKQLVLIFTYRMFLAYGQSTKFKFCTGGGKTLSRVKGACNQV
jgi:hypothetical protein